MIEQSTRIWTENLARSLNRRKFLKKAGEAAFLGVAALMSGNMTVLAAKSTNPLPKAPLVPYCSPPAGIYCNLNGSTNDPNGCKGSACYQHMVSGQALPCRVYYQYYQGGCWTTAISGGGNWTCCDCECLNSSGQRVAVCGCAQFSDTPVPRPDSPTRA